MSNKLVTYEKKSCSLSLLKQNVYTVIPKTFHPLDTPSSVKMRKFIRASDRGEFIKKNRIVSGSTNIYAISCNMRLGSVWHSRSAYVTEPFFKQAKNKV